MGGEVGMVVGQNLLHVSHVRDIPLADVAVEGGGTLEHVPCCVGGEGCCVCEVGVELEWGGG